MLHPINTKPINIKRPEFGILSHLSWDLPNDEEKFHGFLK